jgi:hypothetical protein
VVQKLALEMRQSLQAASAHAIGTPANESANAQSGKPQRSTVNRRREARARVLRESHIQRERQIEKAWSEAEDNSWCVGGGGGLMVRKEAAMEQRRNEDRQRRGEAEDLVRFEAYQTARRGERERGWDGASRCPTTRSS